MKKLKKNQKSKLWIGCHPVQFTKRFENRTGWHPVHNLHTRWHPPLVHPVLIFFKFENRTASHPVLNGSHFFEIWELDGWLSDSQILKKMTTGWLAVRFSNFKKMRTGWLHPGALPETWKIHQNKKSYLSVIPCRR